MLYSLIPRGVRRFFISASISAKPVNDEIDVFITATLPINFAYILRSFNLELTGDTIGDWDRACALRMADHIPGQPLGTTEQWHVPMTLFTPASAAPALTVAGDLGLNNFTSPAWAAQSGSMTFRAKVANVQAAVGAAAFVVSHCDFLEYDLTQAQRFYINTPVPVLAR